MHKLKTVLRSSHRKRDSTSSQSPRHSYDSAEAVSQRTDYQTSSSLHNGRSSVDDGRRQSQQGRRSRPVSSVYDDRRASNASAPHYVPTGAPAEHNQSTPSDSINGSIANDYRSYLPALSPVDDLNGGSDLSLGTDKSVKRGVGNNRHEEDVADRNIDRYGSPLTISRNKALPNTPDSKDPANTQYHAVTTGVALPVQHPVEVPPRTSSRYSLGQDIGTRGGSIDRNLPHKESEHTKSAKTQQEYPVQSPINGAQVQRDGHQIRKSESRDTQPNQPSEGKTLRQDMAVRPANNSGNSGVEQDDRMDSQNDWQTQQKLLLDGVVDLRDTVDVDKEVTVAAPVVHEVVKPHQHEIIQKKIFREIHNYTYYHRIQPVMHTEVLPPRHFIPNPDGEGLIEISADELPLRTGKNRWWDIVQKEVPRVYENQPKWRTEPEVIEGKTYITEEGFERRETTIIYPPTLEDMSEYVGVVQPVHFDHKTGERWLGEVTTMAKLKEQYSEDMLTMKGLKDSLPGVPANSSISRKPVHI